VTQLALFDQRIELLDGQLGSAIYHPSLVPLEEASIWFDTLRNGIDWRSDRRVMYDREVDVPRLRAHFAIGADGGVEGTQALDENVVAVVRAAAKCIVDALGAPFNSVGLNFYRDGNDSVAPHNDRLGDLIEGQPIALLSLGDTRRMLIRRKDASVPAVPVDLAAGSLLVMNYTSQIHYTHGVAKTRAAVGPRISLAFRVRPN
jgi:alkylated DNA repair dioxygenase AlkB